MYHHIGGVSSETLKLISWKPKCRNDLTSNTYRVENK